MVLLAKSLEEEGFCLLHVILCRMVTKVKFSMSASKVNEFSILSFFLSFFFPFKAHQLFQRNLTYQENSLNFNEYVKSFFFFYLKKRDE